MLRPASDQSVLLVVDIQERLSAVMPEPRMQDLLRSARVLLSAVRELRIPALATEQYPKGLGATLPAIGADLTELGIPRLEKMEFSAWANAAVQAAMAALERKIVVAIGMEAHVCVFQTVRDLCQSGYSVFVPVDGVVSRRDDHREVGLALCEKAGATLTTTETLVFDWLERAGTAEFRALSRCLR